MPMNTPYLSVRTASGVVNTPWMLNGAAGFPSDISSNGTIYANNFVTRGDEITAGNEFVSGNFGVVGTSQLTGAVTLGAALNSASAASFGAITGTTGTLSSTLTVGGAATLSASSMRGLADFNSGRTQSGTLSYHTTASATSLILPDGASGWYFESATSARFCFRSGATTYTIIATTGAIL